MTNPKLRRLVIERDGLTCQYCGRRVHVGGDNNHGRDSLVIDHIQDREDAPHNLCVSCRSCNSSKGARSASRWLADITDWLNQVDRVLDFRKRLIRIIVRTRADHA